MSSKRDRYKQRREDVKRAKAQVALVEREEEILPSACGIAPINPEFIREVILYCRVSDRHQDLAAQVRAAKLMCRTMGIKIVYTFAEVASGKNPKRKELQAAFAAARRRNLPVLFMTFSRLLRAEEYHASHNPTARPSREEIENLLGEAKGVKLLTLNDPDSTPAQDEEFTKKAITATQTTEKKETLSLRRKEVRRMRKEGKTIPVIAHTLGVSIKTVNRTISTIKKGK